MCGGDSWQQNDEHERPDDVPHGGGAIPEGQEARGQEVDERVQEQDDCRAQSAGLQGATTTQGVEPWPMHSTLLSRSRTPSPSHAPASPLP